MVRGACKGAPFVYMSAQQAAAAPKSKRVLYGGQAVIEGVMIRGRTRAAVSVRKMDGTIARRSLPLESWANSRARQLPMVRGVLVLLETLLVGMKALTLSANEAAEEEPEEGKEAPSQMSSVGMAVMLTMSLGLGILLFFMVPLFASSGVEAIGASAFMANVMEGVFRLVLFIGYIWLIGRMSDIQRVFGYHGAEHMTVATHEAGEPLTVDSVRRFPKAHPRCGTSFLMTVVLVSIVAFILLPRDPFWFLVASRIVLIPVIASISYELIRFGGLHQGNLAVRMFNAPNLLLQDLTTRDPDNSMIEVAIDAMDHALEMDSAAAEPVPAETAGVQSREA